MSHLFAFLWHSHLCTVELCETPGLQYHVRQQIQAVLGAMAFCYAFVQKG